MGYAGASGWCGIWRRDLARGYISAEACIAGYNLSQSDVDAVLQAVKQEQEIP